MPGQLILSISGVRDRTIDEVDNFCTHLATRTVPVSFLVTPRLDGGYRVSDGARAAQWLRTRREHGDAIVLHGYDAATPRPSARVRGAARSRGEPSAYGRGPNHGAHRFADEVVRAARMVGV